MHEQLQIYVLIFAIGISLWPQFARTVRGSTLVERGKEYVHGGAGDRPVAARASC